MADIFQSGISGLLAAQRSLGTTSHNISNVNTEGFTRQRVEQGTRTPTATGAGFLGNGVETQTVRRIFSQQRETAVQVATSEFQRLDTLSGLAGRLDDLVADQSAGLSPALQEFFGAVQDVANDPTSSTAREALLGQGENLAARFQFLDGRFSAINADVDRQLETQVAEVNELAGAIADLNRDIVGELGRTGGQPPNDLLDERDSLIRQLNERVSARTVEQEDGSLNVYIGSGQTLVSRYEASELGVIDSPEDPQQTRIAFTGGSDNVDITDSIQGGTLGGALDFRREVLDPARDELGRIATTVAATFNDQQNLGLQFDSGSAGQLGEDFFNLGQPQVIARETNTGTGEPVVSIDTSNIGALTGDNYRLSFDGTDYTLTNLADGSSQNLGGATAQIDGLDIDASAVTAGDSFLIRPTRLGASELTVALDRPAQVAAASPLRAVEATDPNGQGTNGGTAGISDLSVRSTSGLPLSGGENPLTLTFNATGGSGSNGAWEITDGNGATVATVDYDPSTDAGGVTVDGAGSLANYGDPTFTLSGVPADGDQLIIENNTNGRGDNTNALALGNLNEESILNGGDTTYQEAYASLVGEIGSSTRQAQVNRDAQESALEQANAARESLSGVNLDEEAANLLRFQQAYQASAQAISIGRSLFDSLLAAVR
ncbi:flagellar hook-associated protein FlgK [Sediminicurvatus halobius]|uniref:Flagellar hook-associated protein 1 n=1 Tax=Sediminicurvatus halobius TaxID=2182432 RepID=A0A2U2MZ87_9GAMM|nr:flagellar hook-associated protein FlgK [Spiribacter halobius]PWG62305.1 flagellar hook-associated protein FlgK [Spiribacter halobius]UEX79774.1 flagellar hook-associated protein FlgK [Spiribacter halobius]